MSKYDIGVNITPHKEVNRKTNYNFDRRTVYCNDVRDILSCDLVDMSNKGDEYKYILNCVDVFSRKLWSVLMKSKNSQDLIAAYKIVFKECKPVKIWSDEEPAMLGKEFTKFLDDKNIILYHTYGVSKSCIVERLNRTMKTNMEKYLDKMTWYEFVPLFVKTYNNTIHSTIKCSPNVAFAAEDNGQVGFIHENNFLEKKTDLKTIYKVNDAVRLQVKKKTFEKGYKQNYTDEIFYIKEVKNTNPITYTVMDKHEKVIDGSFYKNELMHIYKKV